MKNYYYALFFIILTLSCTKEEFVLRGIELDKNELSLRVDEEATLSIDKYEPGIPESSTIEWISSDSTIVSVKSGIVRGISQGEAHVHARIGEVRSPSCIITVDGVYDENNDIYIVGSKGNKVSYWKNGIPTPITDGSNIARGMSIFISGDDVYVAGCENNNSGTSVAKYWKNGQETLLSERNSEATDIAIVGNDVFAVGSETNSDYVNVATIWKNGIATALSDGTYFTRATAVSISNSDVYVVGYAIIHENNNDYFIAKNWKNGEEISLSNQSVAYAYDIEIQGDDVFVAGHEFEQGIGGAKYWKNGEAFSLSSTGMPSFARSMAIENDNIYIAGYVYEPDFENKYATLWTNGIEQRLSNNAVKGETCKIASANGDVYVLVNEQHSEFRSPKYWKNGKETFFVHYLDITHAYDIAVVPK